MTRYTDNQITTRYDNKRVYTSIKYPQIPVNSNDLYYITNGMERLDLLAYKFYNDPTLWWIIALANNIGKGSFSVPEGVQLRIPANSNNIISNLRTLNS